MSEYATYTVKKFDDRRWAVAAPEQPEPLHLGSFVVVWREALRMASRSRPSLVVAVNDAGEVVAREMFDALEPLPMRSRRRAPAARSESAADEASLADGSD
jgi:hypothetical protein